MAKTFAQAALERGIDLAHQIKLWKRRDRYAQHQDRPKFFGTDRTTSVYTGYWKHDRRYTPEVASRDLATLRTTTSTAEYVSAWCRLNNLTGA